MMKKLVLIACAWVSLCAYSQQFTSPQTGKGLCLITHSLNSYGQDGIVTAGIVTPTVGNNAFTSAVPHFTTPSMHFRIGVWKGSVHEVGVTSVSTVAKRNLTGGPTEGLNNPGVVPVGDTPWGWTVLLVCGYGVVRRRRRTI